MIYRSNFKKINRKIPSKSDCPFCKKKEEFDYKKVAVLSRFISDRGKILGRDKTLLCQKHQKRLTKAIKRARHLALLPFVIRVKS